MTAKVLAERLSGFEVGIPFFIRDMNAAHDAGLVVVYGGLNYNVDFRGAIGGKEFVYGSNHATIHLTKGGILYNPSHVCASVDCPYLKAVLAEVKTIKAVLHDQRNPCWTFETDIPHETFNIYEDGELFCVGIVFSVDDL